MGSSGPGAAWSTAGALLPDFPAAAGTVWLGTRRLGPFSREEFDAEVCGRTLFGGPDAALHSTLPVAALLAFYRATGVKRRGPRGTLPAFLAGWAGHVLVDALTHAEDARPILWPLSRRRFVGPISYWDRARHARAFTLAEHATLLAVVAALLLSRASSD